MEKLKDYSASFCDSDTGRDVFGKKQSLHSGCIDTVGVEE